MGLKNYRALAVFLSAISLLYTDTAFAGAWLPAKDSGVVIIKTTHSKGDFLYTSKGKAVLPAMFTKTESTYYAERGINNHLAVVGSVSLQQHAFVIENSQSKYFGLGELNAGLRVKVLQHKGWALSVQPSVNYRGQSEKFSISSQASETLGLEMRGLVGYSNMLKNMPVYFDVQFSRKFGFESVPNETRFDVTLGAKPWKKWEIIAQAYNSDTDLLNQAPRLALPTHSLKAQMSIIYHHSAKTAYQVGIIRSLKGKNIIQERALTAGVWRKF